MTKISSILPAVLAASVLLGCSPTYDWREVRGASAPFLVMLPAKPAFHTRQVTLAERKVDMNMTGAETDGLTFAVGSARLADAGQAREALLAMKTAMVRNIGGKVEQERQLPQPGTMLTATEIVATGSPGSGGAPHRLQARFIVHEDRVYQLVVLGRAPAPPEAVDTFFSSFRPG